VGSGTGTGSGAPGAVGGGGGGGSIDGASRSLAGRPADRPYSLRATYFRRDLFKSTADCLTAAYTQHLPLDLCR